MLLDGVCGPEVDPRLAQFASDLDWLTGHGVDVRRINLAQEPSAFAENPEVKALLERSGDEDLPAIVVGTRLVSQVSTRVVPVSLAHGQPHNPWST